MTLNTNPNPKSHHTKSPYWLTLADAGTLQRVAEQDSGETLLAESCDGVARRSFLKLMAASMGLAGVNLAGCRRWPQAQIVPHNAQPEGTAPGRRQQYASCFELAGVATGVIVTAVDGRPIKIEGNPLHRYSLGAADAWTQASILEMYDPNRSRRVTEKMAGKDGGQELVSRDWNQFFAFAQKLFDELRRDDGRGLAVLQGLSSSPTLMRLAQEWQITFSQSRWYNYETLHRDNEIEGIRLALGQTARPVWDFEKARIVACFDEDLLGTHPGRQRWARQWANQRTGQQGIFNRWYVAEPSPTVTGSIADERLPVALSRITRLIESLAALMGVSSSEASLTQESLTSRETQWLNALHTDLMSHREHALIVVGSRLPARIHALAVLINHALGNVGTTLSFTTEPLANQGPCGKDIHELSAALSAGQVKTLIILGGNPSFDAPADCRLEFSKSALTSVHLSPYFNETSAECTWHLPMAHWLEAWGDGRAWDGSYSVRQPLILPMFEGRSDLELLAKLLRRPVSDGRDLIQETCKQQRLLPADDKTKFDQAWEVLLNNGVLEGSAYAAEKFPTISNPSARFATSQSSADSPENGQPDDTYEVIFRTDSSVYDGRFANNGWLQEMPDPIAKLTWDNAAWISPSDAAAQGLGQGDMVRLSRVDDPNRSCEIAVFVIPGQAPRTIGLSLGYGRRLAGELGNKIGFDVFPLLTQMSFGSDTRVRLSRTGRKYEFAVTQDHYALDATGAWGLEERVGKPLHSGPIVRAATWEKYSKDPNACKFHVHGPTDLELFNRPSSFSEPHAWGMSIDLTKCIGCTACVIACQAENNIPIVGKDQVRRNREMHWIRIDTYFKGSADSPEIVHMPMTCHHCETAPCEQVCPVAATVHDSEGLNTMIYNRCIGTRYCSNNCPAKVRRFNFFDYHSTDPTQTRKPWLGIPDTQQTDIDPLRRMQFNPEVTVRMRGVMEKCTFCTQRIQAAKISARVAHAQGHRDSPLVKDGEVISACAAACPTGAIRFGDLNDQASGVAVAHSDPRAYQFLEELQLRPRTRYLAKLCNPVAGSSAQNDSSHGET